MQFYKKIAGIVLATSLACASLTGCGGVDNTETGLTVNGEEVSMGLLNFYARYEQSYTETYYGSYFGDDMWSYEFTEGTTYEEETKDGIISTLEQLIVVRQHAEELGVSITDEEYADIQTAAEEFVGANDSDTLELVSGDVEYVEELLELFLYESKCRAVMIQDVDTVVTDEESAQKKATYLAFTLNTVDDEGEYITMSDEEAAEQLAYAEEVLAGAEEDGDLYSYAESLELSPYEINFDSEYTGLDTTIVEALDALSEGEFTEIMSTDSAYYIAQLTSEYDEEATEAEVESIITTREDELYSSIIDEWLAEIETVVNESAWSEVDFDKVGVTMYYETTE